MNLPERLKTSGIFLRSHSNIRSLQSHLRRFVRAKNSKGDGVHIRFWKQKWTLPLLSGMSIEDATAFLTGISLIAMHFTAEHMKIVSVNPDIAGSVEGSSTSQSALQPQSDLGEWTYDYVIGKPFSNAGEYACPCIWSREQAGGLCLGGMLRGRHDYSYCTDTGRRLSNIRTSV